VQGVTSMRSTSRLLKCDSFIRRLNHPSRAGRTWSSKGDAHNFPPNKRPQFVAYFPPSYFRANMKKDHRETDLLKDSDSEDDVNQLTINEHYAKAFQYRKEREELAKRWFYFFASREVSNLLFG
jgi:hypothetical protein